MLDKADRLAVWASPPYRDAWQRRAYEEGYEHAIRDLVNGKICGYAVVRTDA